MPKMRREEILEIRAVLNKTDTKREREREKRSTKTWFFKKINEIDKFSVKLMKKKERVQINKGEMIEK